MIHWHYQVILLLGAAVMRRGTDWSFAPITAPEARVAEDIRLNHLAEFNEWYAEMLDAHHRAYWYLNRLISDVPEMERMPFMSHYADAVHEHQKLAACLQNLYNNVVNGIDCKPHSTTYLDLPHW
jgi:hypothetical protein